ncbi:MAG: PAS domain-containing protein [Planctomycetes bacterium]|nr:PAS domain-containing protein [Planctomycetota bacterium]
MVRVLFLSQRGSVRSQMAKGFARRIVDGDDVALINVGVEAQPVEARAIEVMGEVDIDISQQPSRSLKDLDATAYDLVIILSSMVPMNGDSLPGAPTIIRWDIPDLLSHEGNNDMQQWRHVRDEIRQKVEGFFRGGCITAIISQQNNIEVMLDHLSDGILAHDTHRKITWFNRAAEQITGYERREVIGQHCGEIFQGGFCAGKCSFQAGQPNFDTVHYPLNITTKDGQSRRVEMSVVAMRNSKGEFQGVLASFHDNTEVLQLRDE